MVGDMTEPEVLLGALGPTADDVTRWAEDDDPESLIGEDADDEIEADDELV